MPYVSGRTIHDADAHVMETAEWVRSFADPGIRERMQPLAFTAVHHDLDKANRWVEREIEKSRNDPARLARAESEIMEHKNWSATGASVKEDRPIALDYLGFSSQLLFNSFHNGYLVRLEHAEPIDLELVYGVATAHNRAMVDFASVDPRLLATCYVPLADIDMAAKATAEAIELGAAALLIPSACPKGHSPSHIGFDHVWSQAEEAGIPIVFHVGGGGRLISPDYFENGLPKPPDFHGGDENFRSVDYMGIARPPAQTLATMIFDGVLERFPELRFGVIEQGASWLPSWIQQMESAVRAFSRHEERLRKLTLRPTEYVQRQIRVTPFPTENTGWIIDQVGPDICMFSSDYPHVEGGRHPVERFDRWLADHDDETKQKFFCDNFADLMGAALPVGA
jgi:predicted TIM-barrel fold metal-dependent hydrolase